MMTKELARSGALLPEIGMGTSNYHAGPQVLRSGLEAGARFIDTAESYGTDHIVGEAVKGLRDRVFIATKVSRRISGLRTCADPWTRAWCAWRSTPSTCSSCITPIPQSPWKKRWARSPA